MKNSAESEAPSEEDFEARRKFLEAKRRKTATSFAPDEGFNFRSALPGKRASRLEEGNGEKEPGTQEGQGL